jgi:PPOX class probable F420-dependent enzyme
MAMDTPERQPPPERPVIPAGYGIGATTEGCLEWEWARERLTNARNYWVCTTRADGRPHAMPVWGLWLDDSVAFSTDPSSVKGRNVAARPHCVVHLESGDEVVVVEGRAERITDREQLGRICSGYEAKYSVRLDPAEPAYGVYAVRPRWVLGWRETDYPASATKWAFAA